MWVRPGQAKYKVTTKVGGKELLQYLGNSRVVATKAYRSCKNQKTGSVFYHHEGYFYKDGVVETFFIREVLNASK